MAKPETSMEVLDNMVERFKLDRSICPNRSSHWKGTSTIPSDMMFDHDGMFLVKRIANMEMAHDSKNLLNWGPAECASFYREHKLNEGFSFHQTFMTEGKRSLSNWYFKGRAEEYLMALSYRWDNGMMFASYEARIETALAAKQDGKMNRVREMVDEMKSIEAERAFLSEELNALVKQSDCSARLKSILNGLNISVGDILED